MKRLFISAVPVVAFILFTPVRAKSEVSVNNQSAVSAETIPATWKPADTKKVNFVLTEVRKRFETNRESQVTGLSIDPEYRSKDDTYLVNVTLESHELNYTLGVLVTLHPAANGWETTMNFVD